MSKGKKLPSIKIMLGSHRLEVQCPLKLGILIDQRTYSTNQLANLGGQCFTDFIAIIDVLGILTTNDLVHPGNHLRQILIPGNVD